MVLHPLSSFIDRLDSLGEGLSVPPTYYYQGICPRSGELLRLPRTPLAEAIAQGLMTKLAQDPRFNQEGKMYGILLVKTDRGELAVLQAFSGQLQGEHQRAGWVPPIPGREQVALIERQTLDRLEAIKQDLIRLQQLPERQELARLTQDYADRLQALNDRHHQAKQARQIQRDRLALLPPTAQAIASETLNQQSRQEGIVKKQLKQERDRAVLPLKEVVTQADRQMQMLKQVRKALSRQLQSQLHAHYALTNFAGQSQSLSQFRVGGLPTGTGDCCAPKLLHYAATHQLTPIVLAEFWWGSPSSHGDKQPGQFYGACRDRCQPIMGFLLAGLDVESEISPSPSDLFVIAEDKRWLAVAKPSGLLSVPGRDRQHQDSVLSRLRLNYPGGETLLPVHRLDQATSGILLLARDREAHRYLSAQFQNRQVYKVYEALLDGSVSADQGRIDLPLWGDPLDRPRQKVDWQRGKPSQTDFRVIARTPTTTRLELIPLTGRTHQLRVHTSDIQGLGIAIIGDRLYGQDSESESDRLYLHAKILEFQEPENNSRRRLTLATPF